MSYQYLTSLVIQNQSARRISFTYIIKEPDSLLGKGVPMSSDDVTDGGEGFVEMGVIDGLFKVSLEGHIASWDFYLNHCG